MADAAAAKEMDAGRVGAVVQFLLHDPAAAGLSMVDMEQLLVNRFYRIDGMTVDELLEGVAWVVHLMQEIVRLDAVDREFDAAQRSLVPEPVPVRKPTQRERKALVADDDAQQLSLFPRADHGRRLQP
jgi:hypothetical protein